MCRCDSKDSSVRVEVPVPTDGALTLQGAAPRDTDLKQPLCADIQGNRAARGRALQRRWATGAETAVLHHHAPRFCQRARANQRRWAWGAQAPDALAKRHQAPAPAAAGVHAAAGGTGAQAQTAPDPISVRATSRCEVSAPPARTPAARTTACCHPTPSCVRWWCRRHSNRPRRPHCTLRARRSVSFTTAQCGRAGPSRSSGSWPRHNLSTSSSALKLRFRDQPRTLAELRRRAEGHRRDPRAASDREDPDAPGCSGRTMFCHCWGVRIDRTSAVAWAIA